MLKIKLKKLETARKKRASSYIIEKLIYARHEGAHFFLAFLNLSIILLKYKLFDINYFVQVSYSVQNSAFTHFIDEKVKIVQN